MTLLREPLVYFALVAGLLFVLPRSDGGEPDRPRIEISSAVREGVALSFQASNGRPPDADEIEGLVAGWVDEEVLFRSALALGLDRDDTIVRRRLVQKMQFVLESQAEVAPPTDAEIDAFVQAHPDRFLMGRRYTLTHVFVDPTLVADAEAEAARLRDALHAGADPGSLGSPFSRGHRVTAQPIERVEAVFGRAFAEAIAEAPVGVWSGPFGSVFGLHLVRLDAAAESDFSTRLARERAEASLLAIRTEEALAERVSALRAAFDIVPAP